MKLYCDPISTVSRPVLMFAADHDLALERIHVDLMSDETLSADYLAINPNGTVPYLVDGDFGLGESTAILIYLAEKVGSPAYPSEPRARARVNAALNWFNTNFQIYFCMFAVYPHFGIPKGMDPEVAARLAAYGQASAGRWLQVLEDDMLGDRPFVCGAQITLADYLGSALVTVGEGVAFDMTPYPNIERWIARMKALPNWAAANAGFNGFLAALRTQAA